MMRAQFALGAPDLDTRREVYMRGLLLFVLLVGVIYCVMNHDQVLSVGEWAKTSLHI